MTSLWRIKQASACIDAGNVIACPAEAVWGLSCDPWNLSAVAFLCEMKQRALSKGVIVASGDVAHFAPLLDALDDDERSCVLSSWPGPVTWLVPNRGYFPSWITGESNEVAIRVTSASALSSLCRELGGPVVTTSANWAGAQPAKHLFQVRRYFGSEIAVVPGEVDLAGKPSTIKRIKTGEVLR
ncbi:MAG: L-threonylcarbamoyladenylate synthase [Luminiphilus sp.]